MSGPAIAALVPGSYSLVARSREEQVAIAALLGLDGAPRPALVVFCVDATNLSRNLYLVLQAQELGLNLVVALTMVDEAAEDAPLPAAVSELLGCPVVAVIARTGQGVPELKHVLAAQLWCVAETHMRFAPFFGTARAHRACARGLPGVLAQLGWARAVVKRETHGYRWPLFLFTYGGLRLMPDRHDARRPP